MMSVLFALLAVSWFVLHLLIVGFPTPVAWIAALIGVAYSPRARHLLHSATGAVGTKRRIDPPGIEHAGTSIILPGDPEKMSINKAIEWLQMQAEAENKVVTVRETIDVYPWDGARAFGIAVKQRFGFAKAGSAWEPAQEITIQTDVDQHEPVVWGSFEMPGIMGTLHTGMTRNAAGMMIFQLTASVRQKHAGLVRELVDLTREVLKTESIYRGKALSFATYDGEPVPPAYVDLSRVRPEELVYTTDVAEQIETTVFAPLRHRDWCKTLGIPFKRGVCLLGLYGVGKTLAVYVAAQLAKANGITAIVVQDAKDLPAAMLFARQYGPAVLIVEDVDQVTRERDSLCNAIMDALDGVEAKEAEVMVLFTSNHPEHIHEAMRRPGRIDTFIMIEPPDAMAVEKLIRLYGRGLVDPTEDVHAVCNMLAGQIPAVVREVMERAKLAAVARAGSLDDARQLTANDLKVAARRLMMQQALFAPKPVDPNRDLRTAVETFGGFLRPGIIPGSKPTDNGDVRAN